MDAFVEIVLIGFTDAFVEAGGRHPAPVALPVDANQFLFHADGPGEIVNKISLPSDDLGCGGVVLVDVEVMAQSDVHQIRYLFEVGEAMQHGIRQIADEFFEAAGVAGSEITLCAELGSLAAIKQLAGAGLGFAIASRRAIRRDVEEGRLVAIPLQPRIYTPLEVIVPRDKFRSRLITAFADYACEEFARIAREEEGA